MNQFSKLILFVVLSLFLFISSCKKKEEFSKIPVISYNSFNKIPTTDGIDQKGILKINFTDGDGDIGLEDTQNSFPYDYNVFINYYEKQKGKYILIDLPITNNARIPYISIEGNNKNIKGTIEIELFINNPFSKYNTIQFDVYILDRALNKSNLITISDIIVNKN